jgi:hypothetical protein
METTDSNNGVHGVLSTGRARNGQVTTTFALAGLLPLLCLARARGEEVRADFRHEDYREEKGRVRIRTDGVFLDLGLKPWLNVKGNYIYDAIAGATPTGAPPLPGEKKVDKATIDDTREAGYIEPTVKWQNHTLSPQFSYSKESDYESVGLSLGDALELNEKNTTLAFGVSHTFDRVLPNFGESIQSVQQKDSTDLLVGLTQLIGPNTLATVNLTVGYSDGYLTDPYKRVLFRDFPYNPGQPYTVWPEKRPGHKLRQVLYLGGQHYIEKLHGALEASYRFSHDDFGILAHTLSLQWNQKIGKKVIVSPLFRYHTQSEADFYAISFAGDPSVATPPARYYSADYRLSALDTFTYGVSVSFKVHEHISFTLDAKRYEMHGTDGRTVSDQYPTANIFGGGFSVAF